MELIEETMMVGILPVPHPIGTFYVVMIPELMTIKK